MVLVKVCEDVDQRCLGIRGLKKEEGSWQKIDGLSSVNVAKASCLKMLLYSVIYKIADAWHSIEATCISP